MKKLLLTAAIVLATAGCSPSRHHLTSRSEEVAGVFTDVAESYHQEMGHRPLEELTEDCQFARDYRVQLDALEARLERIDRSPVQGEQDRLQVLAEAVAHIGRTARWDTGARGPAYAEIKFETDAGWKVAFRRLCKAQLGGGKYYGKF